MSSKTIVDLVIDDILNEIRACNGRAAQARESPVGAVMRERDFYVTMIELICYENDEDPRKYVYRFNRELASIAIPGFRIVG